MSKHIEVDVLIEGSGWTGCFLAMQLAKEGYSVAIVSDFQHFQSLHNHAYFSDGSMMAAFSEDMMLAGRAAFQAFQNYLTENKIDWSGKNNFIGVPKGTLESKMKPVWEKHNIPEGKVVKELPTLMKSGVLDSSSSPVDVIEMCGGGSFDQEELLNSLINQTKDRIIHGSIVSIDSDQQNGNNAKKANVKLSNQSSLEINFKFLVFATGTCTSQLISQISWSGFAQQPKIEYDCEMVPMICARAKSSILPEFQFLSMPNQFIYAAALDKANNETFVFISSLAKKEFTKSPKIVSDPNLSEGAIQEAMKLSTQILPNLPFDQMKWTAFGGWRAAPPIFTILEQAKNVFVGLPINLIGSFFNVPKSVSQALKTLSIQPSNTQKQVNEFIAEIQKQNQIPTIPKMFGRELNWKSYQEFKQQHNF